jgi:hypothetical protein
MLGLALIARATGSPRRTPSRRLRARIPVHTGQRVALRAAYKSRGLDQWRYRPSEGVARLESFALTMHTDFTEIDFPAGTRSPSSREPEGSGMKLHWAFKQVVMGNGMGMITPSRIQPSELAAALALSAPVSLFLYFFAYAGRSCSRASRCRTLLRELQG